MWLRRSSRRRYVLTTWRTSSSSTPPVTWTCCVASRACRPGQRAGQTHLSLVFMSKPTTGWTIVPCRMWPFCTSVALSFHLSLSQTRQGSGPLSKATEPSFQELLCSLLSFMLQLRRPQETAGTRVRLVRCLLLTWSICSFPQCAFACFSHLLLHVFSVFLLKKIFYVKPYILELHMRYVVVFCA